MRQVIKTNSQYSVHPIPPLNLQVNNLDIFERKILVEGVITINFSLFNRQWLRYKYYQFGNLSKLREVE